MDAIYPAAPVAALAAAALAGFLTGILPVGLAEAGAIAIGIGAPPRLALAMLVAFTLAHVGAKLPWYWLGTVADRARSRRAVAAIAKARAFLGAHPAYGTGLLAVSAVASVPPFHLAAIAAGIVRIPVLRFTAICLGGRFVRFWILGAAPMLVRALLG